jgi:hypothetical protein
MKCDRAIEEYLKLDNSSCMPLMLRFHIMLCRKCRYEIKKLDMTFLLLRKDSPYYSPNNIALSVMNILRSGKVATCKTVSGLKWVSSGAIIFSSIVLINFSESFIWLKKEFGSHYIIPLSIVMGLVLTAYSAILIACNYEYIKKYIELHSRWKLK